MSLNLKIKCSKCGCETFSAVALESSIQISNKTLINEIDELSVRAKNGFKNSGYIYIEDIAKDWPSDARLAKTKHVGPITRREMRDFMSKMANGKTR